MLKIVPFPQKGMQRWKWMARQCLFLFLRKWTDSPFPVLEKVSLSESFGGMPQNLTFRTILPLLHMISIQRCHLDQYLPQVPIISPWQTYTVDCIYCSYIVQEEIPLDLGFNPKDSYWQILGSSEETICSIKLLYFTKTSENCPNSPNTLGWNAMFSPWGDRSQAPTEQRLTICSQFYW